MMFAKPSESMPESPGWPAEKLDAATCRHLLAQEHEGRVSYDSGRGHRAVQVHYDLSGDTIVFSTADYSDVARYVPGQHVAFDLESISDDEQGRWKIHLTGVAEPVPPGDDLDIGHDPEKWPDAVQAMSVRVQVDHISGTRTRQRRP